MNEVIPPPACPEHGDRYVARLDGAQDERWRCDLCSRHLIRDHGHVRVEVCLLVPGILQSFIEHPAYAEIAERWLAIRA